MESTLFKKRQDPTATPNTPQNVPFLTTINNVSDIALSIDSNIAALYGITIDGTNFTITNPAAAGKTITFTVKYTDGTVTNSNQIKTVTGGLTVNVAQASAASQVVLNATHTLYKAANTTPAEVAKATVFIPIADMAAAITDPAKKYLWNTGTITAVNTYDATSTTASTGMKLTSAEKHNNAYLSFTETIGNITAYKADKSAAAKLSETAYIGFELDPASANITNDIYSGQIKFTVTGTAAQGTTATTFDVIANVNVTLKNPTTLTRIPALFDGDNVVAYGSGNSGAGAIFNTLSLYEQTGATFTTLTIDKVEKTEGMSNTDLAKWTKSGSSLTIAKDQMYAKVAKVTVSAELFSGSTNNKFTDTFYVTAKSPVKEGSIEAKKTTLELGQSLTATFTNADFTAKDVWGTAYNLFGVEVADDPATTTVNEASWTAPTTAYIENVTVTSNTSLVTVSSTYKSTNTTPAYAEMTGFKLTVGNAAALQNGQKVTITVKITDKWGIETTKEIELTVVK